MYEELVKSLKICGTPALINEKCIAFHDGCCEAEPVCMYELMRKAADAIEELSRDLDSMNDANIALYGALPKWIPVTERLPEDMVDVLCYYEYFRYGNYNCMFRTIDRGHVFKGRWFGEAGEGHKNKVFAWMPLPEPPKEGE